MKGVIFVRLCILEKDYEVKIRDWTCVFYS